MTGPPPASPPRVTLARERVDSTTCSRAVSSQACWSLPSRPAAAGCLALVRGRRRAETLQPRKTSTLRVKQTGMLPVDRSSSARSGTAWSTHATPVASSSAARRRFRRAVPVRSLDRLLQTERMSRDGFAVNPTESCAHSSTRPVSKGLGRLTAVHQAGVRERRIAERIARQPNPPLTRRRRIGPEICSRAHPRLSGNVPVQPTAWLVAA